MTGYGFNIKFWTLQPNNISEKNISFLQYYNKDANTDGEYHNLKKTFMTGRGELWLPGNKRPDKLREAIKVFEDMLKTQEVLNLHWKHSGLLQVMFSSGLLAHIEVSPSNDIVKMSYEKWFVGKIPNGCSSGVHGDQFVCFAFENQTKLVFSTLKPDYKMYNVELPGSQSKIRRNLCINSTQELMVCWWKFGPWLQSAREHEKVNVILLRCSFGRLEVLGAIETENDLFHVHFSKTNSNRILTLEKSYNMRKEVHLDTVIYECTNNTIQRLNVVSLPVKSGILSYSRNSSEDKLVVGCSDSTIVVYDLTIQKPLATLTRSPLVPSITYWFGDLLLVGSAQGEVRLYDSVLNQLQFFDMEEREYPSLQLSEYLTSGNSLMRITSSSPCDATFVFNGGPLALMRVMGNPRTINVIQQHLANEKVTEAVKLLSSVNWNYEPAIAYDGLLLIADHLLLLPLSHARESEADSQIQANCLKLQLEAALAAFYNSKHPMSEELVVKHRVTVGCYARRFFHHLLRHQRFEKAFLLAKDINSADLFLDIYFSAKDLGEMQLAKIAKLKADEILAADSSGDDSEEWGSLANQQVSQLISKQPVSDQLKAAFRKEFGSSETSSSSTLKVTNLGYV